MEGCHSKHPRPPGPAATRPSGPELVQDVPGMPREGQQVYLPFPLTVHMLQCRGSYQLLPLHTASLPLLKNNSGNYTGDGGGGQLPPGQIGV